MRLTEQASLANALAIAKVKSDLRWLKLVQWIPRYRALMTVRLNWLKVLRKRDAGLGIGARGKV